MFRDSDFGGYISPTLVVTYQHKRDDHFSDASLENSLNAVAGLFVIVWYLHHKESNRKKLGKTVLLSADRYIDGVQWANTYYYKIPEELAS